MGPAAWVTASERGAGVSVTGKVYGAVAAELLR